MGKEEQDHRLPRGVTIRRHKSGQTIQITLTYRGILYRDPLSRLDVNNKTLNYVARLLGEIQNKIAMGTFAYIDYFSTSNKSVLFGEVKKSKRIKEYLDEYIEICINRQLSPSTIDGYRKCIGSLVNLHDLPVIELSAGTMTAWISNKNTKLKTIRNLLSFLRSALDESVTNGLISVNPVSLVTASRYRPKTAPDSKEQYVIDPFTPQEVGAILNACHYVQ